jgi:uncharacterized membrane protein
MTRVVGTFIAGLLVLLPIVLTIYLVIWAANIIITFVGPHSWIGLTLITIGFGLSATTWVAYLAGLLIVAFCIYVLGVIVESRLQTGFHRVVGTVMQRIPLIGTVYDLIKRLIAMLERRDDGTFKGMQPVWCFFGGEGGAATLALLPSLETIMLGGETYHVVLVPSAPVPIGGALVYVPAAWVKPANVGIDGLMSIYVSMGVSHPSSITHALRRTPQLAPAGPKAPPTAPAPQAPPAAPAATPADTIAKRD